MPDNNRIYSSPHELEEISVIIKNYMRLPFASKNIPGAVMEGALGHVRKARVLGKYDFVDVVDSKSAVGWQIKSTLAGTPVTWKRAKIADRNELILRSERSPEGLKALGNAIIDFCNKHAHKSMSLHKLDEIGYGRLIIYKDGTAMYFEKLLCSRAKPDLFNPDDFTWKWSTERKTKTKEQLSALHGIHKASGKKWFAWHGRGENQLHFNGEGTWWPSSTDSHAIRFRLPSKDEKLSPKQFADMLAASSNSLPPA